MRFEVPNVQLKCIKMGQRLEMKHFDSFFPEKY